MEALATPEARYYIIERVTRGLARPVETTKLFSKERHVLRGGRRGTRMCRACFLHPCYPYGLWSATTESTGEGGTPAFCCLRENYGGDMMNARENGILLYNDFIVHSTCFLLLASHLSIFILL